MWTGLWRRLRALLLRRCYGGGEGGGSTCGAVGLTMFGCCGGGPPGRPPGPKRSSTLVSLRWRSRGRLRWLHLSPFCYR